MKNRRVIVALVAVVSLSFFSCSGYAYDSSDIEQFLIANRTLKGNPYRPSDGENVDQPFMIDLIQEEIENFNNLIDDYDDPDNPLDGYAWDLKIFHPGETEGILPSDGGPYPILIICKGAAGSNPELYWSMDWLGSEYAQKGYVVAIPQFIANTSGSPPGNASITNTRVDIYSLQVSQTIDYLEEKFSSSDLLNSDETTVIGHSFGGYVSLRAACYDRRITRIVLLSAYYDDYRELTVLDTYDIMRLLNSLPEAAKPALHVQRYTLNTTGCPEIDSECDPVPVIDGFLTNINLSEDPWIPFTGYCDGTTYDCTRGGTFYHYTLYNGPKEDGIRNNPYLDHSGGNLELGRPEVIRVLDNFFEAFPVSSTNEYPVYSLVETRSTPSFEPPLFYLYGDPDCDGIADDVDNCPEMQNASQENSDSDSHGDVCDNCPDVDNEEQADSDGDGRGDMCDGCPAVKLLGENSEEVKSLRYFRDNILNQTLEGQEIIRLYYKWSPVIGRIMEEDEEFKKDVKEMIDDMLMLIEEKTK